MELVTVLVVVEEALTGVVEDSDEVRRKYPTLWYIFALAWRVTTG
jgi:hypothetical protein